MDERQLAELKPEERLSAVASLLARGFLRLEPSRMQRLRAAALGPASSSDSASYSLAGGQKQSVHADR